MKAVLDANVFVSAAIKQGASHQVVQTWLADGAFELVICPQLLAEVRDVLTERPRLRRWIDLPVAEEFLATIDATADLVPDPEDPAPTTRDPDDDYLAALAREHEADYIVTGDKDLLEEREHIPPIITPAAFLALLRHEGHG